MKPLQKYFSLLGTLLGLFLPLFLGFIAGFDQSSFSKYYFTNAKYIYLVSLTIISISFIALNKKWFIPSLSLMILTHFNCRDYEVIHNVSAFVFFVSSLMLIVNDKRYNYIGRYILTAIPLLFFSIYWFELVCVLLITIFHILYLNIILKKK